VVISWLARSHTARYRGLRACASFQWPNSAIQWARVKPATSQSREWCSDTKHYRALLLLFLFFTLNRNVTKGVWNGEKQNLVQNTDHDHYYYY